MANTARLPWRELWNRLPLDNLPLGYLALKGWSAVFGESEFALRALSALCYAAAAVLAGLAAGRIAGAAAGIGAALLMASSDRLGLEHAATVRSYALLAFIAALALWQTVRLIDDASRVSRVRLALLCLTHLAGAFTHPTYVLLAASYSLGGLLAAPRQRLAAAAPLAAIAVYLALWAPVLIATVRLGTTRWMQAPSPHDLYNAGALIWGLRPAIVVAILAAGVIAVRRAALARLFSNPAARWVAFSTATAWALPVALSVWKPVFEASRTPLMLLPATCVAIAAVLARGSRVALAAGVLVCAAAATYRIGARPHVDPAPSRATIAALLSRTACGDVVIAPGVSATTAEYYFRRLGAPPCVQLVAFPRDAYDVFADWPGRLGNPAIRSRLEREADSVARGAAAGRRAIWLIGLSTWETREATAIVESALQQVAECGDPEPARGAFIDSVRRCRPR
ncbi:MAG TPA: glycosyltransferase family 39 protein [Vicinamibacterales bacterium]|nr:glycosyltransferase family 39 protein [Vicinamibacterales bacterium]